MLAVHENAVLCTNPAPPSNYAPPPPVGARGRITTFSPASRRRLRRLLSTLQWSQLPPARFVTLTLHRVPEDWPQRFSTWLQWLRDNGAAYLWRLEPQKRGAPHWHLIVWCDDATAAGMRSAWHRIAANGSRAHERYGLKVDRIESYRQASFYVSKYLAKSSGPLPEALRGRRHWGASRGLPCAAVGCAEITEAQFHTLRRIARRLIRSRNRSRRARSLNPARFHLFASEATGRALALWLGIALEAPPPPPPAPVAPRAPDRGRAGPDAGRLTALLEETGRAALRTF